MRLPVSALTLLSTVLVLGCFGDTEEVFPTAPPDASSVPVATATPEAATTPSAGARPVSGLFTDPRPRQPAATVNVPPRPPSPFQAWDRMTVVLYDIENGTEVNFGPGRVPSFSEDGSKLAFNPVPANPAPGKVRVIDLATKVSQEFESTGGSAGFADNNHIYLPGPGEIRALDVRTGATTPLSQISDPVLKAKLDARGGGLARPSADARYRLLRADYDSKPASPCASRPGMNEDLCRAEAFEQWQLLDVASGTVVLEFRAWQASFAGPGEIVLATSPQCEAADGRRVWCAEVAAALRADDPPGQFPDEYARGTSNVFLVDIESAAAEFVATADFSQHARIWPANWPLIGNAEHIVWTGAFCGPTPGKTQVLERGSGRLTELNVSLWVEFLPNGDLGVDAFGPRAILDIETFGWKLVLPDNVVDVVQSPDGRYLAVGGVLGHGGLCG